MKSIIVLATSFLILIGYPVLYWNSFDYQKIKIENKERVLNMLNGNSSYNYVIYAENEVFELKDSFLAFHYNTLDVFNNLKIGSTCSVKTAGWRIGFFSMKKNIIKIFDCSNANT